MSTPLWTRFLQFLEQNNGIYKLWKGLNSLHKKHVLYRNRFSTNEIIKLEFLKNQNSKTAPIFHYSFHLYVDTYVYFPWYKGIVKNRCSFWVLIFQRQDYYIKMESLINFMQICQFSKNQKMAQNHINLKTIWLAALLTYKSLI